MELVFGIIAHKVTDTLKYTIDKILTDKNTLIIVHVDKKIDLNKFKVFKNNRIIFCEKRFDKRWGGLTLTQATLELLREANNYNYDYFSLISGEDLLVKSVSDFIFFLKKNNNVEYIAYQSDKIKPINPDISVNYVYPKGFFKVRKSFMDKFVFFSFKLVFCKNKLYSTLPKLYKGTNCFTLSSDACKYIVSYVENNKQYELAFSDLFFSDEIFFHSIVMISEYKNNISSLNNDNILLNELRYIDWNSGPNYPKILGYDDFRQILNSKAFFARKMSQDLSFNSLKEYFG